jgi:uncharacterized protein YciI
MHAPGPRWDHARGFREQSRIADHVGYMKTVFDHGKGVLGGPFLDDSGGMLILDVPSLAEAQAIATSDPTVKAGLLSVTVKPWLAVLRRA